MGNRIEQGRCCEAVIRIFEKLIGSNRKELCLPDTVNRRTKDIEVFVRIGATKLAIEHTLIEPFEHFLKSNHDFGRFKSELDQLVPPCKIPASHGFQLCVPGMAFNRKNKECLVAATWAIADFVIANMPVLANPPAEDRSIPLSIVEGIMAARHGDVSVSHTAWQQLGDLRLRQRPPMSIPLESDGVRVILGIMQNPRPSQIGKLRIIGIVNDIEAKRQERVRKALESKREKLEKYKREGCRTVLILESNDIALTNDEVVFEALTAAMPCVDVASDDIFFADTSTSTYTIRHLVIDRQKNTYWHKILGVVRRERSRFRVI
jgi:hypothetical protein